MPNTADSFNVDLRRFVDRTDKKRPKFARKILFQVHKELTQETPVLTGRAKANWFASEGLPSRKVTDNKSSAPKGAPADGSEVLNLQVSGRKDMFVSNNLPYIEALEHGSSQQAPAGMLRVVVRRMKQNIESGVISPD